VLSTVPTLARYDKNLKHLLLAQKKKDHSYSLTDKSPFYSVILKTLRRASKLESFNALDLLSTTAADITSKDTEQSLPAEQLARLQICLKFLKTVQQAILLHVNQVKRTPGAKTESRHFEEERFYTSLIESVCKYSLKSSSVYLFKLMPQLLHAGFISPKTKDAILQSLESLLVPKPSVEPNLGSPIKASPSKQVLTDSEISFIRMHCIDAIKAKWLDKQHITNENVAAQQFVVKAEEEEPVVEMIDTTSRNPGAVADQIGKKRPKPVNEANTASRKERKVK
jgi:hypothetical protein